MKKSISLILCVMMVLSAFVVTPAALSASAEDNMLIRYHDMWDYVVYSCQDGNGTILPSDDPAWNQVPTGWLTGTDTETWTTARSSIGAQSWGAWNTCVNYQYYVMFLRKSFTVADASAVTGLTLYFLYDEDPVVYINGTQVLSQTGYHDSGYAQFSLDSYVGLLQDGVNTLQIAIRNANGGGGCDAALVCSTSGSSVKGVAKGSVWEYAFTNNDSAAPAPTGYLAGEGVGNYPKGVAPFVIPAYHNNTTDHDLYTILPGSTMTTWFRQFFNVADASSVVAMIMELKYDEDPIVYLNGTEIYSKTGYHDSSYVTVDLTEYKNQLVDGQNCLVVRMVNAAGGGGSIFDMSLIYNDTGYDEDGYIISATASCANVYSFGDINKPENILDNDQSTVCGSGYNASNPQNFTMTFRKPEMITEVYVQCKCEENTLGQYGTYNIYAVYGGEETLIGENVPAIVAASGGYTLTLSDAVPAEAVKVQVTSWTGPGWACLADIKVKATGEDVTPPAYDSQGYIQHMTASCENVVSFGGTINIPENILDNDQSTVCGSGGAGTSGQTFTVTFPKAEAVSEIYLRCKDEHYSGEIYGYYSVYDIYNGEEALIASDVPAKIEANGGYTLTFATPIPATAIKVVVDSWQGNGWAVLADIKVKATGNDPVASHTWSAWTTETPAACTEAGVEGRECTVCGVTQTREIAALGHTFGEWSVTTPVTCTVDGVETRTCSACNTTETRAISAAGHTPVVDAAVAPTCTEPGLTEGSHCSVCGAVITAQEVVPAAGHVWNENGVCTVCELANVAKIGNTFYLSLADAVAAAENGAVITLLADDNVSLTSGGEIEINKTLTITGPVDAQGSPLYTIFGTSSSTGTNDIFITGSGTVTISNLKIKNFGNEAATDPGHAPIYVSTNFTGTVNLTNLYVSDFNRGGIFLYGGTFNVDECYIDCANSRSGAFTKGIEVKNAATGTISNTLICNMERSSATYSSAAIELYGTGDVTVDGCMIVSNINNHSTAKGTFGIVVGAVGAYVPGDATLTVTDTLIDVTNAALSVDAADYEVELTDCSFGNYIATWNAGTEIVINSGDYAEDVYADAGTIVIHGGEFTNFAPDTNTGSIIIDGGTFDEVVPEQYCAEGYIPAEFTDPETGDVYYGVKNGSYAAQIGDDKFETLADAFAAADNGDTIVLLDDLTTDRVIYDGGKTITIDLNGKTVTARVSFFSGSVTVENGTITGRFDVYDTATVTVASDAAINGQAVVWGDGVYGETGCKTPTLNVYGTITNTGDSAITTNGTDKSGANINVYNGASVVSTDDIAIFLPSGNLTVSGGAITGSTAIYAKSGSVTVTGGTITGNGAAAAYSYNGSGANPTGDAIVIENCAYPNGAPTANISGGVFVSDNAEAIASYCKEGNDPVTGFVSGGSFNTQVPYGLCAEGYAPDQAPDGEGMYSVFEHPTHTWVEGDDYTVKPTFTEAGKKLCTCSVCGLEEERVCGTAVLLGIHDAAVVDDAGLTIVGTISNKDVDLTSAESLEMTLTFKQNGTVIKTKSAQITLIYTTLTGIASTNELTAAAQHSTYIDAGYLCGLKVKGVPAGDYTIDVSFKANLKNGADPVEVTATIDVTV